MLKIYSTYTRDIIINKTGEFEKENRSGPAFFIEKVFQKNKLKYQLNSGKQIEILIKINQDGESGKIQSKNIKSVKIDNIKKGDVVLMSTVGGEWILPEKIPSHVKIFFDVQGYLRVYKSLKGIQNSKQLSKIFCLKGTEEEFNKLPKKIVNEFKKKCLIVTKSKRGSIIYNQNKKIIIVSNQIIEPKNTIGAGDTFFANFIVEYLKTNNVAVSGMFATKEVEKFLLAKTS